VKPASFLKDSGRESLERAEYLECDVRAACLFTHTHRKVLNIAKLYFRTVAVGVRTAVARKKAGTLGSGLVDHQMVAGVRFELTTFGLCDLTQLSLRVGLYLHPA